jgi:hypothetical protein
VRKKKSPDVNSKSEREKKKAENEMAETGGQRCGMLAKYWKTTQKRETAAEIVSFRPPMNL